MKINRTYIRSSLWITGLSLVFSVGCTPKTDAEKISEVKSETSEEISEVQQNAAEDKRERREEVAEIKGDAREDIAEINKESSEDSKDAFAKTMDDRLRSFDNRIETLQDKFDNKGASATAALAPQMADVKAKRAAASTQLDGVKGAEEARWRNLRTGVTQIFTDLENSLKSAEDAMLSH